MLLVTGSAGLVGQALVRDLRRAGQAVRAFDVRADRADDLRDPAAVRAALAGVSGIIHLAAVSRVVWGERDPALCHAINVTAFAGLLDQVCALPQRPWLIFASSREVHGDAVHLPVSEDAPFAPCNGYGRSKVAGEHLVAAARETGLLANVVRLANVYGSVNDHPDRVVPAFARTAALGGTLAVHGPHSAFDFTHVDDVAQGLLALIAATEAKESLPPIHLLTGQGTTLATLAQLAQAHARQPLSLTQTPPRPAHVERFVGDPARAEALLGWRATTALEPGFAALVADFAQCDPQAMPACHFAELA